MVGLAACQKGISVGFTTASALVHELMEARDEKSLLRYKKKLTKYRLLIVDELGFVPLSKTAAELLFEVFSERYESGSAIITSNLPFDEWTETFWTVPRQKPSHETHTFIHRFTLLPRHPGPPQNAKLCKPCARKEMSAISQKGHSEIAPQDGPTDFWCSKP